MDRKSNKPEIDWNTLIASAITDLIVGIILLILDKIL